MSLTAPGRDSSSAPPVAALEVHLPGLARYLRLIGARADELDDLIQDSAVVFLRQRPAIQEPARLRAWLRGTGQRLLIGRRRGEARRLRAWAGRVDLWLQSREGILEGQTSPWLEALEACLQELGGRAAEALHRVYSEGEDRAQVAADLALRPLGLKSLLKRSRALLRACVLRRSL